MAPMRKFEVMSKKFNVVGICTNGNYVQKWITKLYYFLIYSSCYPHYILKAF